MEKSSLLSSSNLIPCFPNDITLEILLRLPVKTLLRFSCVCKTWHTFIFSNPQNFARCHLQHHHKAVSPRAACKVVWMQDAPSSCVRKKPEILDHVPKHLSRADPKTLLRSRHYGSINLCFSLGDKLRLVGCCDGVFCLVNYCLGRLDSKIYLWNPALGQCISLPTRSGVGYYTLAVGFGFDSFVQDYIVAKVQYAKVEPEDPMIYRVEIYTLNNNSTHAWSTIRSEIVGRGVLPPISDIYLRSTCVLKDGYLYWLSQIDLEGGRKILCVEYIHIHATKGGGRRCYFVIPNFVTIKRTIGLTLYKGRLAIYGHTNNNFELWLMPEAGSNNPNNLWVIQFINLTGAWDYEIRWSQATDITQGGRIMAYNPINPPLVDGARREQIFCGRLVLYDPETHEMVDMKNRVNTKYSYFVADNYVESLVSLIPAEQARFSKNKKKKTVWRKLFRTFRLWLIYYCAPPKSSFLANDRRF